MNDLISNDLISEEKSPLDAAKDADRMTASRHHSPNATKRLVQMSETSPNNREAQPITTADDLSAHAAEGSRMRSETGVEAHAEPPLAVTVAQRRRWKLSRLAILSIAVIAVAAIIGLTLFLRQRSAHRTPEMPPAQTDNTNDATDISLSPEQRASIAIEIVQPHTIIADVTAPGKIAFNGNRVTPVLSQFNGRVVQLAVEIGSQVRAGQVIGMIDSPDIIGAQSDYQQALTAERSARTAFDLAHLTRERAERLAAAQAIPLRDLQQAQADESRAKDDLQRAQSAVAATRGRLLSAGLTDAAIAQLSSGIRPYNGRVALVSPFSGTVIDRKVGIGQVVQAGQGDPLLIIADLSSVWVNADLYEDQLAKIHVGSAVKITTAAYPNETFAARVDQIGSTVDPDKHTIAVRCVVPNPGGRLKPGMFAKVILTSGTPLTALTVPSSAIITEGNKRTVFVEEQEGKYVKRTIEPGEERDGSVIVKSGLKEGERVVVRGALLISSQQSEK